MRVDLKGLHCYARQTRRGTKRDYWYAWRGGPRLKGKPGSPEFIASFNAAAATRVAPPEGRLSN